MATWPSPIIQTLSPEGHFGHIDHATDSSMGGRPGSNPKAVLDTLKASPFKG